jgi:hypothetical protein
MKRSVACLVAALLCLAVVPASASASFGLKNLSFELEEQGGAPVMKAGVHPFAVTTDLEVNSKKVDKDPGPGEELVPEGAVKDLAIHFPPGLVGNPTAVKPCSNDDFTTLVGGGNVCPEETIIGKVELVVGFEEEEFYKVPLYNLEAPPGVAGRVGFVVLGVPVTIDVGVNPDPPYNLISVGTNVSQAIRFYGVKASVWANPGSEAHDEERGQCVATPEADFCHVEIPEKPFLTAPRSCTGPLRTLFRTDSWQEPGAWLEYPVQTSSELSGCEALLFEPEIKAEPTTASTTSASGLRFDLDIDDPGLTEVDGTAGSDIKKAEVLLPEGFSLNPSAADGLQSCSEAQLAGETAFSEPGAGCPQASKVGTVEVETPLLEDTTLRGEVFVATQDENPFKSMVALYMVIRDRRLGVIIKQPGRVELDPKTGQVKTTFGEPGSEIPQFPFSHLRFRFNEGKRAPLVTPSACGSYEVRATFTPWANPAAPITKTSDLQITSGPGGGPCPSASPFDPGFLAGSIDNTAGARSPFYMRLTRSDADQALSSFSAVLPPGVTGKIAGLGRCSDAAIAAAKQNTGAMEAVLPSCPADSRIGGTLGGAGVGSELTWVGGSLYLAGPFAGDPLSVVAITPAVAGPFDAGTVVVREGLTVDPESAEVLIDDSASEPIPQILEGIPLRLRDLRVSADRPGFTINPTSCEEEQSRAGISSLDASVTRTSRYQASGCGALKFKPKLKISLKGGTRRTGHPELRSVLRTRPGDANIGKVNVTLPPTLFIDNAHISNPCTRVQFNADACPKGSVLGHARAFTPILAEPLEGPVYFRSNGGERELPDVVADLHGLFHIVAVGWVDSVKGRTRTRFVNVPDAPVSKIVLNLKGGRQGLLQNSADLCVKKRYVDLRLAGHNGRRYDARQALGTSCKGKSGGAKHER